MPAESPEPLSPETARLLRRLAIGLMLFAGVMLVGAFLLGVTREGAARWWVLALAAAALLAPLAIRRALPR
jgi:cell division protein FtsW (lipid II flippase)